jgi:hypothetical protein
MKLTELRQHYHSQICNEIIRVEYNQGNRWGYPNFADGDKKSSIDIAWGVFKLLECQKNHQFLNAQAIRQRFEIATKNFIETTFKLLHHIRPGNWFFSADRELRSNFDQYEHLANLEKIVEDNSELASALGTDYIITPDILIGRWAVADQEVNQEVIVVDREDEIAKLTPLREANFDNPHLILHASISCKWTLRSDRSQNARTEALNLVRNRKGNLPHIVAVTAEPLPTRIASLALGTGDLDCVYHFALTELKETLAEIENEDQMDMLSILIEGRRLRDISDLPFDLAI